MKITRFALMAVLWIGLLETTQAAVLTYYVATNGTGNGTTWALATSNIQAAVNPAVDDDVVLVSNGTYYCWSNSASSGYTSMVTVTKRVTIQSVNGPGVTIVDANFPFFTNRCFYITASGTVSGFTITNGHACDDNRGGGVYMYRSGLLTNCWVTGNSVTNGKTTTYSGGGGVRTEADYTTDLPYVKNCLIYGNVSTNGGGGIMSHVAGRYHDCIISNNFAIVGNGGGVYFMYNNYSVLSNCTVISNQCADSGGGVYMGGNGDLVDGCRVIGNSSTNDGAGVRNASYGTLKNSWIIKNTVTGGNRGGGVETSAGLVSNCVISGNYGPSGGGVVLYGNGLMVQDCTIVSNTGSSGGGVYAWSGGSLRNCLIVSNNAYNGGGIYLWGSANAILRVENCTIANNYASNKGGGIYNDSGAGTGTVVNTIVYSNRCTDGANWQTNGNIYSNRSYFNCCITPTNNLPGNNNTTNAPAFSDYAAYNFRLTPSSPCANAASNMDWMPSGVDLDRHPRIDRFSGRPDIGCYELVPAGTMIRVR